MKIKFLGAAGTVTGSSYVLTANSGQAILIDLGMFMGLPDIDKLNYENYEYDCSKLAGAVLTHAHLDHCGRLPILLTHNFSGNIWMTPATRDLTELSLIDSAKIAREDNKQVLFDRDLALGSIDKFKTVEYESEFEIEEFKIKMRDAGHILGSASLIIEIDGQRVVFSGDLGNSPELLVGETKRVEQADLVVMESTYGDRLHPINDANDKLREEINCVEENGGTLLIPAFSLDRTQEILHMIKNLKKNGGIKNSTVVFLDGPMAEKATQVYLKYPDILNEQMRAEMSRENPFEFPGLTTVMTGEQSAAIESQVGTKVIIAGSGMMMGGRILGHAARYLPRPNTRLLIVGYQGEGTLGRELQLGSKRVEIDKQVINVKATISDTQAMSSHADQKQLMSWLGQIKGVKKVVLTHGEDGPRETLANKISVELGIEDVNRPCLNQEIVIM